MELLIYFYSVRHFFNPKNNFKFLMFEINGNKIKNKIIFVFY